MKFFVIPPLTESNLMCEGTAGFYCLAHLYVQNKDYRRFFLERSKEGCFILLDNGAAEQDLVTEDILISITEELSPNLVIPPDVLLNKKQTIKNFDSFIEKFVERDLQTHTKILGCPQGSNVEEWIDCYTHMLMNPLVDRIGLSKIAVPYCWNGVKVGEDSLILESRHQCVEELDRRGLLSKDIHCLGAGDMREFSFYKKYPMIVSTDSCNTIWSGMNSISFEDGNFERVPTPKDYFTRSLGTEQRRVALSNIRWMKKSLE